MTDRRSYEKWTQEDGLTRVQGWAREGLKDWQIARRMGIGASTLRAWREKQPALDEALRRGRAPVDVEAEDALLMAALGYTISVKKPFKIKQVTTQSGARTETEHIEYAEEQVHVPPRITALIYWLKNRRPERWRDRPEAAQGGDDPLDEVLRQWDSE